MLANQSTNRPLSFLASLGGELLVVALLIVIPLAYHDRLPEFRWKRVALGTPLKPLVEKPVPVVRDRPAQLPMQRRILAVSLAPSFRSTLGPVQSQPDWVAPPAVEGTGDFMSPKSSQIVTHLERPRAVVPPQVKNPDPPLAPAPSPITVSQGVQMAKLVKRVVPEYPPLAKSARISGVVHLIGIIAKDGSIRNLQLVSGHPLLAHAALEAVRQWIYKPTLLNNEPVEVIAPIDVNFTLSP